MLKYSRRTSMTKVYIAGPVSYMPNLNKAEFENMQEKLTAAGFKVVNPLELCDPSWEWQTCMKVCIRELMLCDAVIMLPKWESSKGASIEHELAKRVGLSVVYDVESLIVERNMELNAGACIGAVYVNSV